MKDIVVGIVIWGLTALFMPAAVQAGSITVMPAVTPAMLHQEFWIDKLKEPDKVILDQQQIAAFNQQTIAKLPDKVYDLHKYPDYVSKADLLKLITLPEMPASVQYVNGQPATAAYYRALAAACNVAAINANTPVRYGFTVTRASIRTFPTADCVTSQPEDREFDNFQETAIDPAEAVIILHQNANNDWYFVQTYNYRGWLPAGAVAVTTSRQEWQQYQSTAEFLSVTARKLIVGDREFAMGAKLLLADNQSSPTLVEQLTAAGKYAVRLPVRDPNGQLAFELAAVPADDQVVKGYLPYTRANIIRQVFKLQGERYGWGGMYGGWDCSSLVLDVYRSFGFKLPRNADEQELAAGRTVNFAGSDRINQLTDLEPGAAVYMPGHTMMYLGEQDGRPYTIHALGSHTTAAGRIAVMRVVVSDVSLKLRSGKTFLQALTTGKQFQ